MNVEPDRELSSTKLSELPMISEMAATTLTSNGVETVNDLDNSDESPWTPAAVEELAAAETIKEDTETVLTLLPWGRRRRLHV